MLETRAKWSALAAGWSEAKVPAAPSEGDLKHYMENLPEPTRRVLILGCTPSFRQRLQGTAGRIVSVDITEGMITWSLRSLPMTSNEGIIQGDWLTLPLSGSKFEVILGDKVFGNVMPDDWRGWLLELRRVLTLDGVFLTRISPHGDETLVLPERLPFREVLESWGRRVEGGLPLGAACSGLWEQCMDMSTERVTQRTGTQQLIRAVPMSPVECLESAVDGSAAETLARLFVERYWKTRLARWSAYSLQGILEVTSGIFRLRKMLIAEDYPEAERQPILCFEAL